MITDELKPVPTFGKCVAKRSKRNFIFVGSVTLGTIIGFIGLCLLSCLLNEIGVPLLYQRFIIIDILCVGLFTCLVTISFKYSENWKSLVKRFLLLHIILPLIMCCAIIDIICLVGIPIMLSIVCVIMCIFSGMSGTMSMIISFCSLFIVIPINLAMYECLHISSYFSGVMDYFEESLRFDTGDSL